MLNKRQERIISIFYENKEWITGKELARLLGVSDRTIRSDIDAINKNFQEELIQSNIRMGYFLNIDKYNQIYIETPKDIPQTPAQRCTYLIQQLLIHEEGINLTFLQEDIYVSGYSIENDINLALGKENNHLDIIKNLLEKTKNKNIKVRINTVVSRLNVDKLDELGEFLNNYQIEKWKFLKFMPIRERAEKNEKLFEIEEKELENSVKRLRKFENIKTVEYKKQSEFEKSIVIVPNADIIQTQNGKDHYFGNALKEEIIDFDKIFSNGKIRTLVAYNDESVRENIINLIKGLEYVDLVGVATNGNDAYNKIIDLKPEMVFAGYNMPDINGLEIAIKTKENKNIETPIFNIFNDKNDIPEQELQKTINVIGNKLNALIQEPYENRVEDIIKDYKEYKYKK